jgi:4-amino-4-deoxy-L-arabinose transferase-like glycosyltransferase
MRKRKVIKSIVENDKKFIVFVLSLALGMRLSFILGFGFENRIYDSLQDQYVYIDLARNLVAGRGLSLSNTTFMASPHTPTATRPPLYPILLAGLFAFFGESYLAVRLMQAILGTLMCVEVFLIGRKSLGLGTGVLASTLVAIYPPLVMYVRPLMVETLFFFLLATMILLVYLIQEQPNMTRGLSLGIVSGLAFLSRSDVLGLCLLLLVYLVWCLQRERRIWLILGASVVGLVLTLMPWVIRNVVTFHNFTLLHNHGGFQMWEQNWLRYQRANSEEWRNMPFPERRVIPDFETLDEATRDRMLGRMATEFIISHPLIYAKYALSRLHRSYPLIPREELPPPIGWRGKAVQPDGASYSSTSLDDIPHYVTFTEKLRVWAFRLVFCLGVFGIMWMARCRQWAAIPLLLPIGYNVFIAAAIGGVERYRLQIDPYLLIFASFWMVSARHWTWTRLQSLSDCWLLCLLGALSSSLLPQCGSIMLILER